MSSRNSFLNKVNYNLIHIDSIDSTNTYFKENYTKYPTNSVLWTDRQTNGRGRLGHIWESDDDLIFSLLVKEKGNYSIIAPLAIVFALNSYDIYTNIKWPNDIYLNGKKLAGILIEDIYDDKFEASIIGIGINYTNKKAYDGIGLLSFKNIDKEELINKIIYYYNLLKTSTDEYLIDTYKKYSMVLNKKIKYHNEIYLACDIALDGALILSKNESYIKIKCDEIDIKKSILS